MAYKPEKQNPSGHIFFDNAMSGALKLSEKRINRITRQHETGTMKFKLERNPIRAEATPRQEWKIGYDSSIPCKEREPDKWNYPESDWGLMSKFRSQKTIYDEIYEKQANYKKEVESFKELKANNERKILEEKKREIERGAIKEKWREFEDPDTVKIVSQHLLTGYEDESLLDDANRLPSAGGHKAKHRKADIAKLLSLHRDIGPIDTTKPVNKYNISQIKGLKDTNPELLGEWRSERAAKYVNKQTNPVAQPPARELTTEPFRPCGKKVAKPRTLAGLDSSGKKIPGTGTYGGVGAHAAGGMDTQQLQTMLQDTEAQIERQKLVIGLNQPKRFG